MRVFDFQCQSQHRFEGWFRSEYDYQQQIEHKQLLCPLCSDNQIERVPHATRVNFSNPANTQPPRTTAIDSDPNPTSTTQEAEMQAAALQLARNLLAKTEDVGDRFAEEARRMHYGEAKPRNIRGQTSAEVAQELEDEGIKLLRLQLPQALKHSLQ